MESAVRAAVRGRQFDTYISQAIILPELSGKGRTQSIVYHLGQLFNSGELPALPVYIDSPLAINATGVFRLHPECYDHDAREFTSATGSIFGGPHQGIILPAR